MPNVNGPAESSRRAARCFWSSALDRSDAAEGLLAPPALFAVVFTFACVAYVCSPGSTTMRNRALAGEGHDVDLHSRRA